MAALLPVDILRRHALPTPFEGALDISGAVVNGSADARPAASWLIGPDRHLVCVWTLKPTGVPDRSPS